MAEIFYFLVPLQLVRRYIGGFINPLIQMLILKVELFSDYYILIYPETFNLTHKIFRKKYAT